MSERRGVNVLVSQHSREMEEFNNFILEMELLDNQLVGRRFTWVRPNGTAMSRLDRFLVTDDWLAT